MKRFLASAFLALTLVLSFGANALAAGGFDDAMKDSNKGGQAQGSLFGKWCKDGSGNNVGAPASGGGCAAGTETDGIATSIINILMYIIGIISVVMLIFGGILYAISAGDEKKIVTAKHTIIYALVGLAFAIIAWTLVNFVFSVLTA